mgnify:CR=1 FL=1
MAQTLFEGEIYKFRKEGTDLILAGATDNSDETKTFRKGMIVSGSANTNPLIIKSPSNYEGLQLISNTNSSVTATLSSVQDDGYFELFNNTLSTFKIDANGKEFQTRVGQHNLGEYIGTAASPDSGYVYMQMGNGRGDNGGAYIDLIGDTTYTDYGLRMIRWSGGANASSQLAHRGTGDFKFSTSENSKMLFYSAGNYEVRTINNKNQTFQIDDAYVYFKANAPSNHCFQFHNDGNNSNRYLLDLRAGTDNASGTNYLIYFRDGDGTARGSVTVSGGTVSYNPFTGCHQSYLLDADSKTANQIETDLSDTPHYPYGSIMVSVKSEVTTLSGSTDPNLQPDHYVVTSSIHQDKRVYGVYFGSMGKNEDYINQHQIASLGDGVVLVNNQNGNIENGDYITTASGSGGYGCKQNDDLLHNYTVAKSLTDVDWSTESESTKLIACTYHCG